MKLKGRMLYVVTCSDEDPLEVNNGSDHRYFPSKASALEFAKKLTSEMDGINDDEYRWITVYAYKLSTKIGEVELLIRTLNGWGFAEEQNIIYDWESY